MKGKVSLKIKAQKTKKQQETQGSYKSSQRSARATWPRHMWRRHYTFNTAQNPKSCLQSKNLSFSMVIMTCHDDHRIQGQLMGLTKSTMDETILWDEPKQVPTSLTRVAGSFKAANNAPDGYKTNSIDRWEHIKSSITKQEALPRKALTSQHQPQWLESKTTYIKPLHG